LPFVFGLCIDPPDIVLPVEPAGDAMLPPDIVPELAGVDGPDIDPPVWAKAVPASAVAASVMIAKAAVVKVFMVFPWGEPARRVRRLRFRPASADLDG
jgi:hypothetical protein